MRGALEVVTDFTNLLIGGIPLMVVIFGLVEFIKSLGLKGNWLTVVSLLLGFVFGGCYQISKLGMPATFAEWFSAIVFSLAIGLATSGFYKFVTARFPVVPL
jgi:hypothetical protein